ncbi:peptidoglycan DD-metalloendopeptidase family protein [Luminiphilus sp.]|nr:peptidoglycan DD-metalloendopeptidase family protein [Luminiphilus sp.]
MSVAERSKGLISLPLLCCVVALGCAEHPPAVIEDRSSTVEQTEPEVRRATQIAMSDRGELPTGPDYIVQPGDTLYAIAFRLGIDYRSLAALNQIEAPYVILAGQSLVTEASESVAQSKSQDATSGASSAASVPADAPIPPSKKVQPLVSPEPPPVPGTAGQSKVVAQSTSKPEPQPKPKPKPKPKPAPLPNAPVDRWGWPVKGRIARAYAEDVHKGIDLIGSRGDPVRASAAGVVVYAGTGVTGYGALIIVKHNDTYLSAYGHNDALLAAEGEPVSAGTLIARMGSSGTDSVKLHFEIRRNGRPINPATLLPSR